MIWQGKQSGKDSQLKFLFFYFLRHLNVMQERFLRPGGSLELLSVLKTDSNTGVGVGAKLTPAIVSKIQSEVEEGLKSYWYKYIINTSLPYRA